jgi:predicted MPP superfamily phosphohydrolase
LGARPISNVDVFCFVAPQRPTGLSGGLRPQGYRDRLYPAAWAHRWHGLRFAAGDTRMLVSRGAGDTFPLRFNCPREVLLCDLG